MKKSLVCLLSVLIFMLSLVGCSAALPAPQNLRLDTLNNVLSWDEVDGAQNYIVNAGDNNYSVRSNEFSLDNLSAGQYEIKVKAVSADGKESAWSDIFTYTNEEDSLLELQLVKANTEYQVVGAGLASGEVVIADTYKGLPITSIADDAFANNGTITKITMGANIREVGENSFKNCSALERVEFSENLETIGAYAFQGCTALLSVELPDSVTEIGEYAFSYCSSIQSVKLSENLQSLENSVFADCRDLESITIPGSVKFVGELAFSGNESLQTIEFGGGVESIGANAFYGCESLTELSVPGTVKSIGDMAMIGKQSFYGCENLTEISIPSTVTSIGNYAFDETLLYVNEAGLVYVDGWLVGNNDTSLTQIDVAEGTVGIADNSYNFQMSTALTEVEWGQNLREISDYAFFGCRALTVNTLPESVVRIGQNAFGNTANWTGATSGTVVTAGNWALGIKDDPTTDNLSVQEGIIGIADYAFAGETDVAEVSLPSSLVYIGTGAFAECSGLSSITISNAITEIAPYAFYKCSALAQITLPDGLTKIGRSAFYETSGLASIAFPNHLQEIGAYAFYGSGLRTLTFPDSMQKIDECAFYRNESLENIDFGNGTLMIGDYAFYRATRFTTRSMQSRS